MTTKYINTDNVFGERLRTFRKEILKMSQIEFAKLLNIPQPNLSAYENGRNKPTIDILMNISETFHVSIDWLCGKTTGTQVNNIGDLASMMFDLYDAEQFTCHTKLHNNLQLASFTKDITTSDTAITLTFYPNEKETDPKRIFSSEIFNMIKRVSELHAGLINYEYSQAYYDNQKSLLIEKYSPYAITRIDLSDLSESERNRLLKEKIKEEVKQELLMELKQSL